MQTLLDLGHKLRAHLHIVRLQLLHVLVTLEAASEGLDDPEMVELTDQGQGARFAGGLLVAARLPALDVPTKFLKG